MCGRTPPKRVERKIEKKAYETTLKNEKNSHKGKYEKI